MMLDVATFLEMHVVVRIFRSHLVSFIMHDRMLKDLVVRGRAQRIKETFAALLTRESSGYIGALSGRQRSRFAVVATQSLR